MTLRSILECSMAAPHPVASPESHGDRSVFAGGRVPQPQNQARGGIREKGKMMPAYISKATVRGCRRQVQADASPFQQPTSHSMPK